MAPDWRADAVSRARGRVPGGSHVEYFHDHARLEPLLFDGVPEVRHGRMTPQSDRPGSGLTLRPDAERFRVG